MSGIRRLSTDKPQSFNDRCALAFLSALLAFVSGALVWVLVFYLLGIKGRLTIPAGSFHVVWLFTAVMASLGFFRMENLGLAMLSNIWRLLYGVWRILMLPRWRRW